MATEGTQFTETLPDGRQFSLSWPVGAEREVMSVSAEDQTRRFQNRVGAGSIVETDDKATKQVPDEGTALERRILHGDEARERMAQPAEPVTRKAFDPVQGETVDVPLGRLEAVVADPDRETPSPEAVKEELAQRQTIEAQEEAAKEIEKEERQAETEARQEARATSRTARKTNRGSAEEDTEPDADFDTQPTPVKES
jgi:hypothetical protein